MSCASRCPYFRGVLNEGFHCSAKYRHRYYTQTWIGNLRQLTPFAQAVHDPCYEGGGGGGGLGGERLRQMSIII